VRLVARKHTLEDIKIHISKENETWTMISRQYDVDVSKLLASNEWFGEVKPSSKLRAKTEIIVPSDAALEGTVLPREDDDESPFWRVSYPAPTGYASPTDSARRVSQARESWRLSCCVCTTFPPGVSHATESWTLEELCCLAQGGVCVRADAA